MATRVAGRKNTGSDAASVARADDYYLWVRDQAALLRSGGYEKLDYACLADEIEDLGRSEYTALQSDLTIIIQHMLKWDHQPTRRSRSWELSIREHRRRVVRRLSASPSLTGSLADAIQEAFWDGRDRALSETGLADADIPNTCAYSTDDVFDRSFTLDNT